MKTFFTLLSSLMVSFLFIGGDIQQNDELIPNASFSQQNDFESLTDEHVVILNYHDLVDGEPESMSQLHVNDFKKQMQYLYDEGYRTLSLEELMAFHKKGYFPEKSVVITFDDGYLSFYNKAYPIFEKFKFKATVFPVVSLTPGLERRIVWQDHLTFHHMRLMDDSLISIGSHTYDLHFFNDDEPAIIRTSAEEEISYVNRIENDLSLSKDLLEMQTDRNIFALAWPYGVFTDTTKEIAKDLNFKLLFTITEEPMTINSSLDEIPRYSITFTIEEFVNLLTSIRE